MRTRSPTVLFVFTAVRTRSPTVLFIVTVMRTPSPTVLFVVTAVRTPSPAVFVKINLKYPENYALCVLFMSSFMRVTSLSLLIFFYFLNFCFLTLRRLVLVCARARVLIRNPKLNSFSCTEVFEKTDWVSYLNSGFAFLRLEVITNIGASFVKYHRSWITMNTSNEMKTLS